MISISTTCRSPCPPPCHSSCRHPCPSLIIMSGTGWQGSTNVISWWEAILCWNFFLAHYMKNFYFGSISSKYNAMFFSHHLPPVTWPPATWNLKCENYGQVGYPWKELWKCSSAALTLPSWDTPVKSYSRKSVFGKSPIVVVYIVKLGVPVLALGAIFEQNLFSNISLYWSM